MAVFSDRIRMYIVLFFSHYAGRFLDFFDSILFYFLYEDQAVLSRFES
jgi:hypothetical protein